MCSFLRPRLCCNVSASTHCVRVYHRFRCFGISLWMLCHYHGRTVGSWNAAGLLMMMSTSLTLHIHINSFKSISHHRHVALNSLSIYIYIYLPFHRSFLILFQHNTQHNKWRVSWLCDLSGRRRSALYLGDAQSAAACNSSLFFAHCASHSNQKNISFLSVCIDREMSFHKSHTRSFIVSLCYFQSNSLYNFFT